MRPGPDRRWPAHRISLVLPNACRQGASPTGQTWEADQNTWKQGLRSFRAYLWCSRRWRFSSEQNLQKPRPHRASLSWG